MTANITDGGPTFEKFGSMCGLEILGGKGVPTCMSDALPEVGT